MGKRFVVFSLVTILCTYILHGQNIITLEANMFRNADSICMHNVDYSWVGEDGESKVWNFSGKSTYELEHDINYSLDSTNCFKKTTPQKIFKYILTNDSLRLISYENRVKNINYEKPKLYMYYPLHYGDSIISNFKGHGRYCGDHKIEVEGQVLLQADAYGTLILSENDTLRNVLRVYTLTTTSMAIDMDSAIINSRNLKQEIEEKYDWYVLGYRYPLYETVVSTSYSNLTPIASQSFAYCVFPNEIDMQPDEINEKIKNKQEKKQREDGDNLETQQDIIHYNVDVNGSDVRLNYTLDADGTVSTVIADVTGYVCKQAKRTTKTGEHVSINFDCSNMKRERCALLYINVNGKVYSEKVILN